MHTSPSGRLKRHNLRDYVVLGTRLNNTVSDMCCTYVSVGTRTSGSGGARDVGFIGRG